jgi:serine phosphatase RsbU (regulator of sigma subunit)
MLLYTDGITEGKTGAGAERLGIDGLQRLVSDHITARPGWQQRPDELLAEVISRAEALNGEELTDDVAMLLIGSRPRSAQAA